MKNTTFAVINAISMIPVSFLSVKAYMDFVVNNRKR
jgi:hypothetical protein